MTLGELLGKTRAWFEGLGLPTARLDAEVLIAHALGVERIAFYTEAGRPLTEDELAACRELVRRRGKREPVAYILGTREFWSRDFAVDPRVLIPRPDTETLVQVALDRLAGAAGVAVEVVTEVLATSASEPEPVVGVYVPGLETTVEYEPNLTELEDDDADDDELDPDALPAPAPAVAPPAASPVLKTPVVKKAPRVRPSAAGAVLLDYGTGSGAIAVTLAAERPGLRVLAIDASADALEVAKTNAGTHAVEDRVGFVCSDGFARVPRRFLGALSGIVANPPYVPLSDRDGLAPDVRDHEPAQALFAGPDPLMHYRRIASEGGRWLTPGGFAACEVGAGQAKEVAALFHAAAWSDVRVARDLAGLERVVSATTRAR